MEEEIQFYIDSAKEQMEGAIVHTKAALNKLRAGKAMPNMLDGLTVDYYGVATPIGQASSINTPDARTITIKPFEKSLIQEIEKAIINSDLGLNPQNDGESVIINIPPLSEERRKILVKHAHAEAESGKVSIRNARKEANESLKDLLKQSASEDNIRDAEGEVQNLTNAFSKKIDEFLAAKEVEIMTV